MSEADLTKLRDLIDHLAGRQVKKLPPEPKLSEELGVTRGRLRTLLKRLEETGEIWRHVGKGTFIGQRPGDPIKTVQSNVSLSALFQARSLIEPQLAAQAAISCEPTDIQEMLACFADMKQAKTFTQWKLSDARLHRLIAKATRNPVLVAIYETLKHPEISIDDRLDANFFSPSGPKTRTDNEHKEIIDAIVARDPQRASKAMRAHIQSVQDKLFMMD